MTQPTMTLDADGWLSPALRIPSPNFDERPDVNDISLLVIHNISLPPGEFGSGCVQAFFCNRLDHSRHPFFQEIIGVEVSSHLFIERDGNLVQFVPLFKRAWHAGKSCFQGREICNDFSIGIELEGTDSEAYEDAQYHTLAQVTELLMRQFPALTSERITGHSDIAPGRKTDPGPAFDWARYRRDLSF